MRTSLLAASLAFVSIVAVACSSEGGPSTGSGSTASSSQDMGSMNHGDTFAFGEPADPTDADRTVEVEELDPYRYDPVSIDVNVGETITFELRNTGQAAHEFVLGDAATQDQHEGEMGDMDGSMMADEANAVGLDPSEEKSLTWTFTRAGTVLYGCHVDDHYAQGMVGEIHVNNS